MFSSNPITNYLRYNQGKVFAPSSLRTTKTSTVSTPTTTDWTSSYNSAAVAAAKAGATQEELEARYGGQGTEVYNAYQEHKYDGMSGRQRYDIDYAAAKTANESRYQDILGQYEGAYNRNMGYLADYAKQESQDISNRYGTLASSAVQDLTGRGLGNTTVTASTATGIAGQESAEQRRLASDVAQQKTALDTGLTQAKLQYMERRTDEYPNLETYLQLYGSGSSKGSSKSSPIIISGDTISGYIG